MPLIFIRQVLHTNSQQIDERLERVPEYITDMKVKSKFRFGFDSSAPRMNYKGRVTDKTFPLFVVNFWGACCPADKLFCICFWCIIHSERYRFLRCFIFTNTNMSITSIVLIIQFHVYVFLCQFIMQKCIFYFQNNMRNK